MRMRAHCHDAWGECYPYAVDSTTINATFIQPENWVETLGNAYEEAMQNPVTGEFSTYEMQQEDLADNPTKTTVLYKMPPDDISSWVAIPVAVLGSDAMGLPGSWDAACKDLQNI